MLQAQSVYFLLQEALPDAYLIHLPTILRSIFYISNNFSASGLPHSGPGSDDWGENRRWTDPSIPLPSSGTLGGGLRKRKKKVSPFLACFWGIYSEPKGHEGTCPSFPSQSLAHSISLHLLLCLRSRAFLLFSVWPHRFSSKEWVHGFPGGSVVKNLPAGAGRRHSLIPVWGRSHMPG